MSTERTPVTPSTPALRPRAGQFGEGGTSRGSDDVQRDAWSRVVVAAERGALPRCFNDEALIGGSVQSRV